MAPYKWWVWPAGLLGGLALVAIAAVGAFFARRQRQPIAARRSTLRYAGDGAARSMASARSMRSRRHLAASDDGAYDSRAGAMLDDQCERARSQVILGILDEVARSRAQSASGSPRRGSRAGSPRRASAAYDDGDLEPAPPPAAYSPRRRTTHFADTLHSRATAEDWQEEGGYRARASQSGAPRQSRRSSHASGLLTVRTPKLCINVVAAA